MTDQRTKEAPYRNQSKRRKENSRANPIRHLGNPGGNPQSRSMIGSQVRYEEVQRPPTLRATPGLHPPHGRFESRAQEKGTSGAARTACRATITAAISRAPPQ